MSFISRVSSWFASALNQGTGVQMGTPLALAYEETRPGSNQIDAALQIATVWACVDLLSKTIASLPVYVYRRTGEKRDPARGTPLWALIHDAPNRRHGSGEFWRLMALNYFLKGNAYGRITRARGRVVSIWPLIADQVTVSETAGGDLEYEFERDGRVQRYSEADILHIRGPGNGTIGMSRLDYMRNSVGQSLASSEHSARAYRTKGRRSGILTIDRVLDKGQREAVKANFESMLAGDKTLAVLEAGFKYDALGMSPADMQLLETQRFTVEEICRWFGVPSVLVNDSTKTTTWGTGVGQIIEGFVKFTLRPELVTFEQALRRQLLSPAEREQYEFEFGLDGLLRSNLKDRMDIYSRAVQNGIYTRNEARQFENMPPVDGGDVATAQTNLVPLDKLGQALAAGGGVSDQPADANDATTDPAAQ